MRVRHLQALDKITRREIFISETLPMSLSRHITRRYEIGTFSRNEHGRKMKCAATSIDVTAHFLGGSGGIRTHGTGLPHNGFQDRLLRPLGHASIGSNDAEPGLPSAS